MNSPIHIPRADRTSVDPLSLESNELGLVAQLVAHEVLYLVVGGVAVRVHGHERGVKDLDLLVENSETNATRFISALNAVGVRHPNLRIENIVGRKRQINLTDWGYCVDVITLADGIDFHSVYERRLSVCFGAVAVSVISKRDLIAMKLAAARTQDIDDVAALTAGDAEQQ